MLKRQQPSDPLQCVPVKASAPVPSFQRGADRSCAMLLRDDAGREFARFFCSQCDADQVVRVPLRTKEPWQSFAWVNCRRCGCRVWLRFVGVEREPWPLGEGVILNLAGWVEDCAGREPAPAGPAPQAQPPEVSDADRREGGASD